MLVNTVLGAVDSADLGQTLMHEHISTADWSLRVASGADYFRPREVADRAVLQFNRAKEQGVSTIVDGTPLNMGRDIELIREVSERTGLNFVASTGFYYLEEPYLAWGSEEKLRRTLTRECEQGIAATGIRPGIMKAACGHDGVTPTMERSLRVVATVAAEQGLPVFVHHEPGPEASERIIDIFEGCGAHPEQLILGHSGDTNDLDHLERMARRGCHLGMDRFGYAIGEYAAPDDLDNRVRTIVELHRRGLGDQLMLSHDLITFVGLSSDWQDFADAPEIPDPDFTFIHARVLPMLGEAGLTEADLVGLMVDNPRRIFEGAAAVG